MLRGEDVLPTLNARVSATNTVAVQVNASLVAALTNDRTQVEDLHNARRLRVLHILGRGEGCLGREMLDACDQVGQELLQAHQQVDQTPEFRFYFLDTVY